MLKVADDGFWLVVSSGKSVNQITTWMIYILLLRVWFGAQRRPEWRTEVGEAMKADRALLVSARVAIRKRSKLSGVQ